MSLYEINQELMGWLDEAIWDDENDVLVNPFTGEELSADEVKKRVDELADDKQKVLEYVGKMYVNNLSEANATKHEEERMRKRRMMFERKAETLKAVLERECEGKKTNLGVVTVSYRKTRSVQIDNEHDVASWLEEHGYGDCLKYNEPELKKNEIKALIGEGEKIPGAWIEEKLSCCIK